MPVNMNAALSALDKPNSLAPFFLKDSLDNAGRTVMASMNGGKHEAREKFIEETGTSLFWIGGIPAFTKACNKIFKNKFNTNIHFKRINTKGIQNYFADELVTKDTKKFSTKDLKGINLSGDKLDLVKNKLKNAGYISNKTTGKYGKYHVGVTAASVLTNLFMLTVALPKFNQLLTKKIITKEKDNTQKISQPSNGNPSFGSMKEFFDVKNLFNFTKMAESAQINPTSSMLLLDYGISGSRTTFIPRNNNERIEYAIKEGGTIFFFYYAADLIKKGFSNLSTKIFKTPTDLDYKVIVDDTFAKVMKNKDANALNFTKENANEVDVIKFIDSELKNVDKNTPKNNVFKNFTLQMAQKAGLIDVEYDNSLKSWIRHSEKFIETDEVMDLNKNLKTYFKDCIKNASNVEKVLAKTKTAKLVSIFGNIGICCVSLSYLLPKIQYFAREKMTQTKQAPGIKFCEENV